MDSPSDNDADVETPLIDNKDDTETCGSCLAAEYQLENLFFDYSYPGAFAQSQFVNQKLYFIWKIVGVIFTVVITITCFAVDISFTDTLAESMKWFIYLTNWSLLLLTTSAVVELVVTVHVHKYRPELIEDKPGSHQMPCLFKVCWVLYNISTPAAFCVSILYWSMLYSPSGLGGYYISSFFSHGLNSIYALLNFLITSIPSRALHVYQPMTYLSLYGIFSLIYQMSGGTNYEDESAIYPFLNWNRPGVTSAFMFGVTVLVATMHAIICIGAFLRSHVATMMS